MPLTVLLVTRTCALRGFCRVWRARSALSCAMGSRCVIREPATRRRQSSGAKYKSSHVLQQFSKLKAPKHNDHAMQSDREFAITTIISFLNELNHALQGWSENSEFIKINTVPYHRTLGFAVS
jgi:hypothetical protein